MFQLEDQGQPSRQYIAFAQFAQLCYRGNEDRLSDADFYTDYYTNIIKNYSLKDNVTPKREKLMFQDVADMYHIINSNTTTLFIYQYDNESKHLYNEIKDKEYLSRKDYQSIAFKFMNGLQKLMLTKLARYQMELKFGLGHILKK